MTLNGDRAHTAGRGERLLKVFLDARDAVYAAGFAEEIDWQDELSFRDLSETSFLREAAWVILSSGMRESVIRAKFPEISEVFLHWKGAEQIQSQKERCRGEALRCFAHERKIDAILAVAESICAVGFNAVQRRAFSEGVAFLVTFPFIGPVTCYHLAKNIGLDVVKPDRHLLRISSAVGYSDPDEMCRALSVLTGEKVCVIDLVFWRFATLESDYTQTLGRSMSGTV